VRWLDCWEEGLVVDEFHRKVEVLPVYWPMTVVRSFRGKPPAGLSYALIIEVEWTSAEAAHHAGSLSSRWVMMADSEPRVTAEYLHSCVMGAAEEERLLELARVFLADHLGNIGKETWDALLKCPRLYVELVQPLLEAFEGSVVGLIGAAPSVLGDGHAKATRAENTCK
jgi:hypothetical protein